MTISKTNGWVLTSVPDGLTVRCETWQEAVLFAYAELADADRCSFPEEGQPGDICDQPSGSCLYRLEEETDAGAKKA